MPSQLIAIGNPLVRASGFSPAPHRACMFPRTRRSIGWLKTDWWPSLLPPLQGRSNSPTTAFLLRYTCLSVFVRLSGNPLCRTRCISTFRSFYLCICIGRSLLWSCRLDCACNTVWPFVGRSSTQPHRLRSCAVRHFCRSVL